MWEISAGTPDSAGCVHGSVSGRDCPLLTPVQVAGASGGQHGREPCPEVPAGECRPQTPAPGRQGAPDPLDAPADPAPTADLSECFPDRDAGEAVCSRVAGRHLPGAVTVPVSFGRSGLSPSRHRADLPPRRPRSPANPPCD